MTQQSYDELSTERKELQERGWLPEWYNSGAWQIFKSKYAVEGEQAVLGRFQTISNTLVKHLPKNMREEYRGKFFNLLWKGWLSPASPVLANTGTTRGLPVSCSGGVVGDSVDDFYTQLHEQAILSKHGFGCSADFNRVRARGSSISVGGKASGAMDVISTFADMASKISQGSSRRGATASYVGIDHGDFDEICDTLELTPDGLNIGWIVNDAFVEKLKNGDEEANRRFERALYVKLVTGKGYFFFVDKVNRARPEAYIRNELYVHASNLCNEIRLFADSGPQGTFESDEGGHTFTCVLSSMNISKYDEWKDTDAIFVATIFLDCVVSEFLERSKGINGLQRAHRFTRKGRPIGLGQLGFATYLQSKMIAYESLEAYFLSTDIAEQIDKESLRASQYLAKLLGEPTWCKGLGVRNTHRVACAPNKTSSQLMGGISESFSPDPGMVWTQSSAAGDVARVAPEFLKLLKSKGLYNDAIIRSIIEHVGSCQHLVEELTDEERAVFKTAFEIDQFAILRMAAARQPYVDQGQSLNLYVSSVGDEKRIAELHSWAFMNEWIHGLYYCYSQSGVIVSSACVACEG